MVKLLIGGSPCTYWSIAQTKNRETVAEGMGWELFLNYRIARDKYKPDYFLYENNKSMSPAIRAQITRELGLEPVLINSALVSAQNRQRLYWVGKRNADGTYSKVNVEQPEDRCILLKDVLDSAVAMREKGHVVIANAERTTEREFFKKSQGNMVAETINVTADGKARTLIAQYEKQGTLNIICATGFGSTGVAESVCVAMRGRMYRGEPQHYEARDDGKTNALTSVEKDNRVAEPLQVGAMPRPNGELSTSQAFRVYGIENKSVTINSGGGGAGGKTGLYAIPCAIEFDENGKPIKAIGKDGKQITVYEVRDGQVTIKGKQYPIKLRDGFYIIRKLTVSECMRLQTVPEWYDFSCVSNSQAYKMLGNGWTVDVISHIMSHFDFGKEPVAVLSMYDGMSCGRIALEKLGVEVGRYYATEIDKYAIKTTMHNYPDTIQLGDAFAVRTDIFEGILW